MPGTTRSRLWRLRSTTIVTLPSPPSASSSDGLPDVALVELGVADEGDEPALRPLRRPSRGSGAAGSGRRAPRTAARPRPGRPSRWRSRRDPGPSSATGTTGGRRTRAACGRYRHVEVAEQVLERVVGGRGVRLDGDQVARAQPAEVERGQDRDDRGARGLVAADLQAIGVLADVVGLVDHPRRRARGSAGRSASRVSSSACRAATARVRGRRAARSEIGVDDRHGR